MRGFDWARELEPTLFELWQGEKRIRDHYRDQLAESQETLRRSAVYLGMAIAAQHDIQIGDQVMYGLTRPGEGRRATIEQITWKPQEATVAILAVRVDGNGASHSRSLRLTGRGTIGYDGWEKVDD